MKTLLAALSLGRTPDARLNLSATIGTTIARQVLSSLLYFVALWITTRALGPARNGNLATALLLPQTLFAFLNLGLGASHVYHLSSGNGNPWSMRKVNWALALLLWLAVALALAASSAELVARYLPGVGKTLALHASLLFPMLLLAAWTASLIQGRRDYRAYNRTLLVQPFTLCATVALLLVFDAVSVESVLACYIVSQMALWLMSESAMRAAGAAPAGKYQLRAAIGFGLRAHLSNVITFLNYRLALYLVSFMLGASAAGSYALAVQLAEVLWMVGRAACLVVYPESAAHSKSPAQLEPMVRRVAALVLKVTLAGAVLAGAAAPLAIPLVFGKDFRDTVAPFILLLPGIVIWSYMTIIANTLVGMGCQRVNIYGALLCLAINVVGDALAIPAFGTSGAALVSTIGFSATACYTMLCYRKIMAEKLALPAHAPAP